MDWYNRSKRASISASGASSNSPSLSYGNSGVSGGGLSPYNNQRSQFYGGNNGAGNGNGASGSAFYPPNSSMGSPLNINNGPTQTETPAPVDRASYYFSQYPLYCADWRHSVTTNTECIALSSYKEGFTNKLQVVHGSSYGGENSRYFGNDSINQEEITLGGTSPTNPNFQQPYYNQQVRQNSYSQDDIVEGFDFHKVAEISLDYPITNLQWDPSMGTSKNEERLAASLEVLRLYKVDHDTYDPLGNDFKLVQTHILANNTAGSTTSPSVSSNNGGKSSTNANIGNNNKNDDINTFPPVTSFDWNKTDPNIIITSSVDTTCTVWDLHRSHPLGNNDSTATDTAAVKTQLIAHDSEVFDVKFVHNSSNIFASVGNDGSMRVFDLRALEHSTIIYEPTTPPATASAKSASGIDGVSTSSLNSRALLKLSTSNIDQHHLATIGFNSNQVIIIDMRMPGLPVATLDGSLGGVNHAAINLIKWHPTSHFLLTGGDDCQALVWDCNNIQGKGSPGTMSGASLVETGVVIDLPVLAYEDDLEVNYVSWRGDQGDWMGVVSGKGFQAVLLT
jgi:WD repeat-containing protein 68